MAFVDKLFHAHKLYLSASTGEKIHDNQRSGVSDFNLDELMKMANRSRGTRTRISDVEDGEKKDTSGALGKLRRKRVVFISARVHPGETPASYCCQGFIEAILSDTKDMIELRENNIFFVVPMLNPDGVFLGNYRCSYQGVDLNRCWSFPPDHYLVPTIGRVKGLMMCLDRMKELKLDFYVGQNSYEKFYSTNF